MLVAFALMPLDRGEDVGRVVAEGIRVVRASGLSNHTDSMFTTLEGEWDEVMRVIKASVDEVQKYSSRISVVMRADIQPGAVDALTGKVRDLERYLEDDGPSRGL